MKRRTFIAGLGSAAAWPVVVPAQQAERARRIGVLLGQEENNPATKSNLTAFTQALADLGWTDGRNLRMDVRWAGGNVDRIRFLAKELADAQPDVIVANNTPATAALQQERRTIPIVFAGLGDPVASGLVASLNEPGGNITGLAFYEASLGGKWLELLSEIAPGLKQAAIMFNPDTFATSVLMPSLETAARSLNVALTIAPVHSDVEIEAAINALGRDPRGGLVAVPDVFNDTHRATIITAAARHNVPAGYWRFDLVRDGGLLSYGFDQVDLYRRAATYVDRILRGVKPAELPIQFPAKFEMVVNLKTPSRSV
jgi:putative ABC transport system substrate-binding protein